MYSLRHVAIDIGFLILGAIFFTLSHPNPLHNPGIAPLGFFVVLPLAWVLTRVPLPLAFLYGAFYGWLAYSLFNYWLALFDPVAWFVVPLIYLTYHVFLFPALALVLRWKSPFSFWLAGVVWVAYEYLRTQGFLGYSYGILGYTQYENLPWIQSADLFGVWGVTLLTVWPAFLVNQMLVHNSFRRMVRHLGALAVLALANLVYGLVSPLDTGDLPRWRVALIQHDMDPWQGGLPSYRQGYERLRALTDQALADAPEAVVWSETAFVPSIAYHQRYREDPDSWQLVRELLDYLGTVPVPVVLGNGHGERVWRGGHWERVDYNAALWFDRGELRGIYRKVHLVPFTEHFPYRDLFPWFYDFLVANDVHFWEAGNEFTVFDLGRVRISTPICFEDTFGYLNREFVLAGADVLVNLTNDSWSKSRSSMRQHYAMAVFRCVENRRSMVRSTNGGWTAAIDPNGRAIAELPPMTVSHLTVEVPLVPASVRTVYTRWGDGLAWLCVAVGVVAVLALGVLRLTKAGR